MFTLFDFTTAFNRTTLELKLSDSSGVALRFPSFNRTTLELKHVRNSQHYNCMKTFNRTTLELKHYGAGDICLEPPDF